MLRLWCARLLKKAGVNDYERLQRPLYIVRRGPYRLVRHPMYVGSVVMLAGAGMLALGWGGVVLGYAVVPFLRARALMEDDFLGG